MSEFKVNFPMGVFCSLHQTQYGETYKVTIDPAQFRGNPTDEHGRTSFWVSTSRNGKAYANLCSKQAYGTPALAQAKTETIVDDEEISF